MKPFNEQKDEKATLWLNFLVDAGEQAMKNRDLFTAYAIHNVISRREVAKRNLKVNHPEKIESLEQFALQIQKPTKLLNEGLKDKVPFVVPVHIMFKNIDNARSLPPSALHQVIGHAARRVQEMVKLSAKAQKPKTDLMRLVAKEAKNSMMRTLDAEWKKGALEPFFRLIVDAMKKDMLTEEEVQKKLDALKARDDFEEIQALYKNEIEWMEAFAIPVPKRQAPKRVQK